MQQQVLLLKSAKKLVRTNKTILHAKQKIPGARRLHWFDHSVFGNLAEINENSRQYKITHTRQQKQQR